MKLFEVGSKYPLAGLLVLILSCVVYGRLFSKAGKSWWLVLIPVANILTFYDIIKRKRYLLYTFFCVLAISLFNSVVCDGACIDGNNGFTFEVFPGDMSIGLIALYFIAIFVSIFFVPISTYLRLGRVYQKSTLFKLGLIFLNPIFMVILAFDRSEYSKEKL